MPAYNKSMSLILIPSCDGPLSKIKLAQLSNNIVPKLIMNSLLHMGESVLVVSGICGKKYLVHIEKKSPHQYTFMLLM